MKNRLDITSSQPTITRTESMRTKLTCVSGISALLLVSALTGCGDDDSSTPPDANEQPDAGAQPDGGAPDAGTPTFDKTKKTQVLSTGITTAYVEAGNPDGEEVVIMLHGWTDTSRSFFPTIEALVASNTEFHIYALDQRGHGDSSMPDPETCAADPDSCFEITDLRDDVLAFMDAKSIETAHLVGHSMGSQAAQELALAEPDRVESLTLIGTAVLGADNAVFLFLDEMIEGRDADMNQWRGLLEAETPGFQWPEDAYELVPMDADPNIMEFMETIWVTEVAADPAFLTEVIPETMKIKIGTWTGVLNNLLAFNSEDRLAELTVPTLVLWATQDTLFLEPDQDRVKASLDAAIEQCNLPYYFHKTYGKVELPAEQTPITDIGHNVRLTHVDLNDGTAEGVAADITSWITNQEPTEDLTFATPGATGSVETEVGTAVIVEKQQANPCTPP